MQTILYTSPNETPNEIEIIAQIFDLGLDFLYIRKPDLDDFSLVDFVEKIPEKYWHKCISTSLIITKEFDLGGYHFTRDIITKNANYNQKVLEWLHSKNKISSVSAHNINDIKNYADVFKHIIVSPVVNSISKPNYPSNWNKEELEKIAEYKTTFSNCQLFAVGGVNVSNINEIKSLKFDGVGILGALWSQPEHAVANFQKIIDAL